MLRIYTIILCTLALLPLQNAYAQHNQRVDSILQEKREQKREEIRIHFRVAKTNIDKSYMDNEETLNRIVDWVNELQSDSMINVVAIEFCGACSPEGSVQFNRYLSKTRLTRLEDYVRGRIEIPEEIITRSDHYIAWSELKDFVVNSDLDNKNEVLEILNRENTSKGNKLDSRIGALKAMDNGKTWMKLFNSYFANLRNAYMVVITEKSDLAILKELKPEYETPSIEVNTTIPTLSGIPNLIQNFTASLTDPHYMYVKTNTVGLGMLKANAAVEIDLG